MKNYADRRCSQCQPSTGTPIRLVGHCPSCGQCSLWAQPGGLIHCDNSDCVNRVAATALLAPIVWRREWGWDTPGRKRPNPDVVRGRDGRPVEERPTVVRGGVLYTRLVPEWEQER